MSISQRFSQLNPDQQRLIELHAVVYVPLKTDRAAELLNLLGVRQSSGRRFTADHLRVEALPLLREGILLGDPTETSLQPDWYEVVARELSQRIDLREWRRTLLLEYESFKATKWPDTRALMRDIRLAFYVGDDQEYQRLLQRARTAFPISFAKGEFSKNLYREFDARWLTDQTLTRQNKTVATYLPRVLLKPNKAFELRAFLQGNPQLTAKEATDLRAALHWLLLFSGQGTEARELLQHESREDLRLFRMASYYVANGHYAQAHDTFLDALRAHRIATEIVNAFPADASGVFFLYSVIAKEKTQAAATLEKRLKSVPDGAYNVAFDALRTFVRFLRQREEEARVQLASIPGTGLNGIELLTTLLVAYWIDTEPMRETLDGAAELTEAYWENGLDWLAWELSCLLIEVHPVSETREIHRHYRDSWAGKPDGAPLLKLFPRREPWERTLDALLNMSKGKNLKRGKRLVWYVDFDRQELEVKEQTEKKTGGWTAGRKVPLKQLRDRSLENMLPQDIEAGKTVRNRYGSYRYSYQDYELELDFGRAMLALAGHPHLFLLNNRKVPVQIISEEPRLLVEETGIGYELRFNYPFSDHGILLIKETPTRFLVMKVTEQQAEIGRTLGKGITAPPEARQQIEEMSKRLDRYVNIQKAIGDDSSSVERKPGDPRPCLHLLPLEEGFKLEFFVKPLTDRPPYRKPGQGSSRLSVDTPQGPIICVRDSQAEVKAANAILEACPLLSSIPHLNYEWLIEDTETCLRVLMELYPLRAAGRLTLEHPKGEKIRLNGIVGMGALRLRVKKERDWFAVDGELMIDETQVLDFQELLDRVNASDSDFVELSDGQFLALTEELRAQLLGMGGLLQNVDDMLGLPALAAMQLDEFAAQLADFEVDAAWGETLERMRRAQDVKPAVPAALRAELRPYQREGYEWLMRLATWGVGACLADDMGLGKTVQALAAILARRDKGPALVVAPASVTRNWLREAHKFTPTLNPILLGPGDRQQTIHGLDAGDILLVSYGLLPFVGDDLSERRFGTIVLDEAQAIKNRATKRSKAAMSLQGDFRIATTGTPIENHLGELWNLFRYLNPGLLGSHRHFNEQFAQPIARYDDRGRREQLRKLIQPFVLRRRKEEVLKELPPKTEVTLNVELSSEERAFYEALRRRALAEIASSDGASQRFAVLAQLTRLRQAACHPKLVEPSAQISSSKLELVAETITELLDNGHKALVFSQFVKHLRLVEQWVEKNGISYQYLDGQTPGAKRDTAVQAFQAGEGDLFLISLKAGGTGLNLTAADYVLHLDPWWNPAVEDQASDRAHRIGQQRPVTVYRFVTEDTIEEKIVKLHHEKRDLADSLLAGTESSASLSVNQMLDLIREGSVVE